MGGWWPIVAGLLSNVSTLIASAVAQRGADAEAARVAAISALVDLGEHLRGLRASERADEEAQIKAHLEAIKDDLQPEK